MEIGSHVKYVDERGVEHDALVTANWDQNGPAPSLNVVYVSTDEAKHDQYGRQIERGATSVVHESNQAAHGRFWREP